MNFVTLDDLKWIVFIINIFLFLILSRKLYVILVELIVSFCFDHQKKEPSSKIRQKPGAKTSSQEVVFGDQMLSSMNSVQKVVKSSEAKGINNFNEESSSPTHQQVFGANSSQEVEFGDQVLPSMNSVQEVVKSSGDKGTHNFYMESSSPTQQVLQDNPFQELQYGNDDFFLPWAEEQLTKVLKSYAAKVPYLGEDKPNSEQKLVLELLFELWGKVLWARWGPTVKVLSEKLSNDRIAADPTAFDYRKIDWTFQPTLVPGKLDEPKPILTHEILRNQGYGQYTIVAILYLQTTYATRTTPSTNTNTNTNTYTSTSTYNNSYSNYIGSSSSLPPLPDDYPYFDQDELDFLLEVAEYEYHHGEGFWPESNAIDNDDVTVPEEHYINMGI